jgi:uncharacterized membrane protein YeaQ/YmgE (transglycosylase-associated protein family)
MKELLLGIVLSFIITGIFDILLNITPPPIGAVILREYFDNHTLLSAALIAGFVGAITFLLIYKIYSGVPKLSIYNMFIIFCISSLIGIPMRLSGLFPKLDKYYYQKIPRVQSFLADGLSGVMVASVYYFMIFRVL